MEDTQQWLIKQQEELQKTLQAYHLERQAFERVALGAGWCRETWTPRLTPNLSGEAQATYMVLNDELARDCEG